MTEYAIPLDQLLNGQDDSLSEPKQFGLTPRVDVARGVFITSRGDEIRLSDKPINALVVQRLQQEGKPKIPMIEVTILGRKQSEPHAGHEGYQARLAEWTEESQMAVIRYLFVVGTKEQPPQSFVDEQASFFPNATDQDMKYLWVCSLLPDDDMADFTEALMGRAKPTEKAVEQVANFTASK